MVMAMTKLSDAELQEIADKLAEKLESVFESIGFDISTQESRRELRDDHAWMRDWRRGANKARNVVWGLGFASFVSGCGWLLWYGIVEYLKKLTH